MRAARGITAVAAAALLALAACGSDNDPRLMNLRSSTNGPDEFGILPPKALDLPEDLASLPEPTPGGENRTDPQPLDDAVVALGGTAQRGTGVPPGDSALYAQAGRYGVAAGIRQTLASEDLDWRRDNNGRVLEKLFKINVYYRAYRKESLDQEAELARWRRAGARTPSAPPLPDN